MLENCQPKTLIYKVIIYNPYLKVSYIVFKNEGQFALMFL